jgi:Glycosyltransferase family 87
MPPLETRRPLAWRWLLLPLLGLLGYQAWPHLTTATTSFPGYWTVARMLLEGTPAVDLYQNELLAQRLAAENFSGDRMLGPPGLALTLLPLAWLPYTTARAIWILGALVPALALCLAWLGRRVGGVAGVVFALWWAWSRPVQAGFEVGQVYPLFLVLLCLGLHAWEVDKARLGGLALAPLVFLRGWHGLPQAFGWLWSRRPAGTLWAGVGIVGLVVVTLPLLGIAAWRHFVFVHAAEAVQADTASALAYQTWRSFALHLTTFHPRYSPSPPLSGLGPWLWVLGVAAISLGSLWATRRLSPRDPLGFAIWTLVATLLAPFAEDYQLVLLAMPAAVIWSGAPRGRAAVVVALLLLLPAWHFNDPALSPGWLALKAYPRVYGSLLLWIVAVVAAGRSPKSGSAAATA